MFRYSGSKKRQLKYLPPPPDGTHCIIEPFAGSAAYGLHYMPRRLLLMEKNEDVAALWNWLIREASDHDVEELELFLCAKRKLGEKVDIRTFNLTKPQETLARLTSSGVYVGQLSSWIFYPQHSIDFSAIRGLLGYIKESVEVVGFDFGTMTAYYSQPGVMLFLDPPYFGTAANYQDKTAKKNLDKIDLRDRLTAALSENDLPTIFTYGEGAPEVYPTLNWTLACERKVPRIRTGGCVIRKEWVSLSNWVVE